MAKASEMVQVVIDRWAEKWRERYGKEPPKVEGHARRSLEDAVKRLGVDDVLAAVGGYFADQWPERLAHEPGFLAKHVDRYAVEARVGGRDGATGSGIIQTGDEDHEAECERWRKKWAEQV